MKVQISGTRDGEDWPEVGGSLDVSKVEADDLIAAGLAESATAARVEEKAVAKKAERRG